jgi:hypothetical protein
MVMRVSVWIGTFRSPSKTSEYALVGGPVVQKAASPQKVVKVEDVIVDGRIQFDEGHPVLAVW